MAIKKKPASKTPAKPKAASKPAKVKAAPKAPKMAPKSATVSKPAREKTHAVGPPPARPPAPTPSTAPKTAAVPKPAAPPPARHPAASKTVTPPRPAPPVSAKPAAPPKAAIRPAPRPTTPPPVTAPAPAIVPQSAPAVVPVPPQPAGPPRQKIAVNEMLTVKDLAEKMNVKVAEVIKTLIAMGTMATINQRLDPDTASLVAAEFNFDAKFIPLYSGEGLGQAAADQPADLTPRAPVVTVMGHVDHGKTSLLDAIRKTRVAEKEAGAITQHLGAHRIETPKGGVVFLDTPGHEAFTAMRARGASVTDLVVLVVAADDGPMPQTVEAIDHAKAASVPILVAINKMDLPTANPQRIKQELTKYALVPEDWGGKTIFCEVSARTQAGLDQLLQMILLEAELLELKANPNRAAQGVVLDATMDTRRGPLVHLLVQNGTLRVGDAIICGLTSAKVRALIDVHGRRLKESGPSTPVEVLGFEALPHAGDTFVVVADEREARRIADRRRQLHREESLSRRRHLRLEDLGQKLAEGKLRELRLIIKADVRGSLEALQDSFHKLQTSEIRLNLIHSGIGPINESDVILADASDAVIIGFNVRPDTSAESIARQEEVDIRTYRIIYDAVADVRAAMEGLLEPDVREVPLGRAEIRDIFRVPKVGNVAGCHVSDGKVSRNAMARLVRNGVIVFDGKLVSLKRFKDDAREVEKGLECGIGLENFQDVKKGDLLEFYTQEKIARKLGT